MLYNSRVMANLNDDLKKAVDDAVERLHVRSTADLLRASQGDFMQAVRRASLSAAIDPWGSIHKELESGTLDLNGFVSVLPEFLAVGRFRFKELSESSPAFRSIADQLRKSYLPALVRFRQSAGIVFAGDQKDAVVNAQLIVLRLLLSIHPSVVNLTLIDTTTLGRSLKLLVHLKDAIKCHVLSDGEAIEQEFDKLRKLVIGRNGQVLTHFDWLYEYNEEHHETPESYHIVLLADGAAHLTEKAQRVFTSLLSGQNAAHAGIYFVVCSEDYAPYIETMSVVTTVRRDSFDLCQNNWIDTRVDGKHANFCVGMEAADTSTLRKIQDAVLKRASLKQMPPVKISIEKNRWWKCYSQRGLCIPIGKAAAITQELVFGEGRMTHNALVGGKVGSGKSILLHTIILNAACLYSPDELRFHLLDYKLGTEFQFYRDLPHLGSLSIGPSVEFGLDVLTELHSEIERRAKLFKTESAKDLDEYREKTGKALPRHLLIIDEFQVLLMDSRLGNRASELLEDLVLRGRSFGLNTILSTQSLRDCNLSAPTRSNLVLRICLSLSENDCADFLGSGNVEPSRLDRPGAALYNDEEGRVSGNKFFQSSFAEASDLVALVKELSKHAAKNKIVIEKPCIYEVDQFVSAEAALAEVGAVQIVLGREAGLRGAPVCFPIESADARNLLVAGRETDKLLALQECLVEQLTRSKRNFIIVADAKSNRQKSVLPFEEASHRWQQTIADGDGSPKGSETVYVLIAPERSRALREPDAQQALVTLLQNQTAASETKFVLLLRSYSGLSALGLFDRKLFSHFALLDSETLSEHNGVVVPFGSKDGWFESDCDATEGRKFRLASFSE